MDPTKMKRAWRELLISKFVNRVWWIYEQRSDLLEATSIVIIFVYYACNLHGKKRVTMQLIFLLSILTIPIIINEWRLYSVCTVQCSVTTRPHRPSTRKRLGKSLTKSNKVSLLCCFHVLNFTILATKHSHSSWHSIVFAL